MKSGETQMKPGECGAAVEQELPLLDVEEKAKQHEGRLTDNNIDEKKQKARRYGRTDTTDRKTRGRQEACREGGEGTALAREHAPTSRGEK